MRARLNICLIASVAGLFLFATPASALQLTPYSFSSSFDGSGSTTGPFGFENPPSIAVNEETSRVFVLSPEQHAIDQFDAIGNPVSFSAPGLAESTSLPFGTNSGQLALDNSDNPETQGRIYYASFGGNGGSLAVFEPSGEIFEAGPPRSKEFNAHGVAIDPATGDIWISGDIFNTRQGTYAITQYSPAGVPTGRRINTEGQARSGTLAIDSRGNIYMTSERHVYKYNVTGDFEYELDGSPIRGLAVDPTTDNIYLLQQTGLNSDQVIEESETGATIGIFPVPGESASQAIAINGANGEIYIGARPGPYGTVDIFDPGSSLTVPDSTTEPASQFGPTSATLNGVVEPEGISTTDCHFEYVTSAEYEAEVVGQGKSEFSGPGVVSKPCANGSVVEGSGRVAVSTDLAGLTKGVTYYYRLSAANDNGATFGRTATFSPSAAPTVGGPFASDVHSDTVLLHATIGPEGATTTYYFEYGEEDCATSLCAATPSANAGSGLGVEPQSTEITGLASGTKYHYRVVAENHTETVFGPDHTFITFPFTDLRNDPCSNSHVRQQTAAALLPDCRAYELVSATDTGGYDVESNLVPGQEPFGSYPHAEDPSKVLYGVHDGGIPGTNHPTDRGVDPYVATRGEEGWNTEYVGIPADNRFALAPFSSVPSGTDSSLRTFAFGAPGGCSPCFEGGYTGIPVRLFSGEVVQGMAGPESPDPTAGPDGYIAKNLSANGEHFVFGSSSKFAEGGNDNTGDVSIYDHNLVTGETHVVSNGPEGHPLTCMQGVGDCHSPGDTSGIAELDISHDGTHILLAQKVGVDANGNTYWHLYMNIGDSAHTIDLTPGATNGVLYDGMTDDGSKVFFTTEDRLLGEDVDSSADIYRAEVSEAGPSILSRISTGEGGPGNVDSCAPVANANGIHWNADALTANCDAVAIGGGGGVAAAHGSIYFLSPELLDGAAGVEDAPNLYLASPGQPPTFVATLEPNNPVVLDSVKEAAIRKTGDFQVTPSGEFAAFAPTLALSEYDNAGHSEVYRYDAATDKLDCVSCDPTNAQATGDASLASEGLSLTDDGKVFFNSTDPLAPRDLNGHGDVYEWEPQGAGSVGGKCDSTSSTYSKSYNGCVALISTGTSPFASSLLGVSADGADAYFFTRDRLVPQDENGTLVKIYDARQEGGFPYTPPPPLCKASDECHGAGSPVPTAPPLGSKANSGSGNAVPPAAIACKKGFVEKHRTCVKKPHPRRHHHHKRTHHHPGVGK
jgi:hypothetical protein